MVKKLQKMADKKKAAAATGFPAGLLDSAMAQNVKDSAQQIWAAGLASFSKAQGEGSKVFEALVSEGLKLQKKTQSAAEEKLSAVATKVSGMAGDVGAKAGQHWDKLESIFEARVAKALKTLNVPSAGDVQSLIKRIDDLAVSAGLKKAAPAKAAKVVETLFAPNATCTACTGAAKNKPMKDMVILWGLKRDGAGYSGGTVLKLANGKTYKAKGELLSPTKLQVSGCLGFICKHQEWTREH